MSSLVVDVLVSSGKLEKKDLQSQIAILSTNSYKTKKEVFEIIHQKYTSFNSNVKSCKEILNELCEVKKEVEVIENSLTTKVVRQLKDSTCDFERLSEEHSQTVQLLEVLEKLCKIDECFDKYKTCMASAWYYKAAESVTEASSIFKTIDTETAFSHLEIFQSLQKTHMINTQDLLYNTGNVWKESVVWHLPKDEDDRTTVISLTLCAFENDKSKEKFENCIKAMHQLDSLRSKLIKFGECFIENILQPLVENAHMKPVITEGKQNYKLNLEHSKKGEQNEPLNELFSKVSLILSFLWKHLLHFKVTESGVTAMAIFSSYTREKILNLLLEKGLAMTIPKTKKELSNYHQISKVVDSFESMLCDMDFLPSNFKETDSCSLSSYAANINSHFANQQCKDILAKARVLMLNEVRNTVQVCNDDKKIVFPNIKKKDVQQSNEIVLRPVGTKFGSQQSSQTLADNTLKLPRCAVSVCAKEIVQLAYDTLCESVSAGPVRAIQLIDTVHNIFELFVSVVPDYHREELEKLPRLSAIHYNDCMYIAHHLLIIGHQFSSPKSSNNSIFVDKVPMFRQLGAECFLNQMKSQREQIRDCMQPVLKFADTMSSDKTINAEKAIKQVMYQLNHLRKILIDVLPREVMKKSLGTLVNFCIKEHVDCICKMEDISADDSDSLKLISQLLSDKVPDLFAFDGTQDLSWHKFIPKWNRLQELIRFLNCGLSEIVERWADGKGPLAVVFTITEVKSLIRALFQNTERRANALLKIRI